MLTTRDVADLKMPALAVSAVWPMMIATSFLASETSAQFPAVSLTCSQTLLSGINKAAQEIYSRSGHDSAISPKHKDEIRFDMEQSGGLRQQTALAVLFQVHWT